MHKALKKKLYLGRGNGVKELEAAWREVHGEAISDHQLSSYLKLPQGSLVPIGLNGSNQFVYWAAVGEAQAICKQALADFWPLVGDSMANWIVVERCE
ncbi:hypothetical protein HUR95_09485 [Caldalkalibacillus thermarum TA2.A1]|uniref:Uncharacterized protein n=1 Tax=Caldalkalibacillus thermarum (strain TA2.A1) TaxID=986075 RepID=A0A8X8I6Z8_CALTT|nr:hypothetical protein [Caldalkalibacillus thermarum]QZT32629.1 hypothetical protein HUR95_09485 [Caldalkalibacillus thermarum TA2.A1]